MNIINDDKSRTVSSWILCIRPLIQCSRQWKKHAYNEQQPQQMSNWFQAASGCGQTVDKTSRDCCGEL